MESIRRLWGDRRPAAPAPDYGLVELAGGGSRLTIVPELGGRVTALHAAGRSWLDAAGMEERWNGAVLARPEVDVRTPEGVPTATCTWRGGAASARWTLARETRIGAEGEVVMRWTASSEGRERLPLSWTLRAGFPLTADTRVALPPNARLRVLEQHGIDLFGAGSEHLWPRLQGQKGRADLTHPDAAGRRYACRLAVEMSAGHAGIEEGASRLDIELDPRAVPLVELWLNKRGWSPDGKTKAPLEVALTPTIGAGAEGDALEPGATREWTLVWRGA